MSQRLEEAALKVKDQAPIPRIALYDIGYPRDDAEYTRLNGYALLLVTAVSQNKNELPLRRIYVVAQDREIELKLLKFTLSDQTGSDTSPVRAFGAYREDALFLFPVKLRVEPGTLLVDFSQGQSRFQLGTFGPPVHPVVARLALTPVSSSEPARELLETFIRREYPGFFQDPGMKELSNFDF